jgi:membrane protein required for colicin V production
MTAHWNGFDWFLVVAVAVSTAAAFSRGIIRVLFSIGGLIAGILIASWNYESLALRLRPWIGWSDTAEILAFLLILISVVVVFGLVASLLRRTVSAVGLGIVDRLLGAGFGLLRGCLIGVVAMMVIAAFIPESPWVKNSQLAPYFLGGAHAVCFVVPGQFQKQVAEGATHILQRAPEFLRPHTLEWNAAQ